jgi:hypothetical protein
MNRLRSFEDREDRARIRIFNTNATIFSGSQILALPSGAVLILPPDPYIVGALAVPVAYFPNGDQHAYRDLAR